MIVPHVPGYEGVPEVIVTVSDVMEVLRVVNDFTVSQQDVANFKPRYLQN